MPRTPLLFALGFCVIAGGALPRAQAPAAAPRHLMMVVSKQQPGIVLYNADTDAVHCKSGNLGIAPHEGEFSPDGRMVYVPTYGSSAVGAPGTDEHVISFIRTSDCQTEFTLDTGDFKRPHHVQVGKSGLVYVTAELKESILVIDPVKRAVVGTLPTGSVTTHMIALTADEKTIYTSNVMGRTLSVVDVAAKRVTKSIPTETNNQRITISPDQKWFVTNLGQERRVAFYRTSDAELDFAIDIDGGPFVSKFSRDGRFLYVMGSAAGGGRGGARGGGAPAGNGAAPPNAGPADAPAPPAAAAVGAPQAGARGGGRAGGGGGGGLRAWKIDVATRSVVGTISENLGGGAGSLEVNPFNGRVYMSAMANDLVTVIDPATWTVVKQITSEDNPDGIFFGERR